MVVFAQAFPKYEVDRVCNQVDEDLKYLDRKQSSNVSIWILNIKNLKEHGKRYSKEKRKNSSKRTPEGSTIF